MNAETFLQAVIAKAAILRPQGVGKEWTAQMYPLLHEVGQEAGFAVNCKPFLHQGKRVGYGEIQGIDLSFFKPKYDPDGLVHRHAAVLIEHENNWDFASKSCDFLKLCMFISKLRVFMGYCGQQDQAERQARQLVDYYNDHELRQVPDGETLVMISWYDLAPDEWVAWVLRGSKNSWERLRSNRASEGNI